MQQWLAKSSAKHACTADAEGGHTWDCQHSQRAVRVTGSLPWRGVHGSSQPADLRMDTKWILPAVRHLESNSKLALF